MNRKNRDLDTLTVSEMSKREFKSFRNKWIAEYVTDLHLECGTPKKKAKQIAEIRFEDYMGQEGYTRRDLDIKGSRESRTEGVRLHIVNSEYDFESRFS